MSTNIGTVTLDPYINPASRVEFHQAPCFSTDTRENARAYAESLCSDWIAFLKSAQLDDRSILELHQFIGTCLCGDTVCGYGSIAGVSGPAMSGKSVLANVIDAVIGDRSLSVRLPNTYGFLIRTQGTRYLHANMLNLTAELGIRHEDIRLIQTALHQDAIEVDPKNFNPFIANQRSKHVLLVTQQPVTEDVWGVKICKNTMRLELADPPADRDVDLGLACKLCDEVSVGGIRLLAMIARDELMSLGGFAVRESEGSS